MIWNNSLRSYDYWIFDSFRISPESLGIYRIVYSLYVLFISGVPNWSWLSRLPDDTYNPPAYSLASFFSGFPNYYILLSISTVICIFYMMLLFGYKTKVVSFLISGLYIVGNSFLYSRGKIDHTDLFLILIPVIMAFSNWHSKYSIDSKTTTKCIKTNSWPVALLALLIGFAYFSAGVPKLIVGWLNPDTYAVKDILFSYYYSRGHQAYLAPIFLYINSDLFWGALDYLTVIFEVSFLFTIFVPTLFRFYIFIAIFFHLAILLILDINFSDNLVAYILFIDWDRFSEFLKTFKAEKVLFKLASLRNLIIFSIIMITYYLEIGSPPFEKFLGTLDLAPSLFLLSAGLVIAMINVAIYLRQKRYIIKKGHD